MDTRDAYFELLLYLYSRLKIDIRSSCLHTVWSLLNNLVGFGSAFDTLHITLRSLAWWIKFANVHEGAVKIIIEK